MRKGVFGLTYAFYAALAFILALLGRTILCVLLLGFIIASEKDEWAVRQVIQAVFLSAIASIVSVVLNLLNIFAWVPLLGTAISAIISFVTGLISLIVLILVIVALTRVIKEQEANVPLAAKFAKWAYGLVELRVYADAPPVSGQEPDNIQNK